MGIALVGGLLAAPLILGGAFVGPAEWLGVLAGGGVGFWLAGKSRREGHAAYEQAANRMRQRSEAINPA